MRHQKQVKKLKRKKAHRTRLLQNLSLSLIRHERIQTSLVHAKALRGFIEPLITRGKTPNLHNKRIVLRKIQDRNALRKIFENIAPRYATRPGGYTRIYRLAEKRKGDQCSLGIIEFVEESLGTSTETSLKSSSKEDTTQSLVKTTKKTGKKA